jgi:hypothetical protein
LLASAVVEFAAVAGAIAAAVAALASWRSVALNTRRSLPRMQGYLLRDGDGRVQAVVRNSGGGLGEGTHVMAVIGAYGFVATIGDGFLAPGDGARVLTPIQSDEAIGKVVMFCRDTDMTLRSWSSDGGKRVYRSRVLRRRNYPDNNVIFNDHFPGTNLRALEEVPTIVVSLDATDPPEPEHFNP